MRARPYDVVLMLTSFDVGGTERQMVELVRRLDPTRFRPHLACFRAEGRLLADVPEHVQVREFRVRGFARPAALRQFLAFAAWCRSIGAELVHTCDLYANIFGLPAAALAGVPARIANRREILTGDKTPAQLRAQAFAYRAAHLVVANSDAVREQLEREGVPPAKLRVIPNGLAPERFTPAAPRPAIRRVVTVANLRPEKGHETLLAAAPQILARHPDASFTFVGDGPRREPLETLARAMDVGSRVHFLGECRDVATVLAEADLFVLPSRSEAFPNAVIEAMAAGLPVVATDVGGIPEIIRHWENGVLVPPGDEQALANAVVALMDRPGDAATLGRAARADVEHHYTFDRMVEAFEHLYLTEIASHVWNRGDRQQPHVAH